MRRTLAFLTALLAISLANPILEKVYLSEFQTSPDSLERIELVPVLDPSRYPFEIGGAQIVTNAGTATIDSGVCFETPYSLVVVDSTNTTGTFSLRDDFDDIRLFVPCDNETLSFSVRYPANPHWNREGSWVPPRNASASSWSWNVYVPPYEDPVTFHTWYIDKTPTFGSYNDDNGNGIWGCVSDQDSALDSAVVRITSLDGYGTSTMRTDDCSWIFGRGHFEQKPTGPGTFTVTVECPGYLPYTYPESIVLGPGAWTVLDIRLQPAGVADAPSGDATSGRLCQRGRTLVLDADRPGTADVTVHDNLGRVRMSEKVALIAGKNELALPSLPSGVYFATAQLGTNRSGVKVILW